MRFALALLIPTITSVAFADDTATWSREVAQAIKRHDAKAIAARLATPFDHYGWWFADADCARRFSHAGVLQTRDRDTFARCVAKQAPQMSTRASAARDGSVITVEPGIEIELLFNAEGKLRWFGPAGAIDDKGTPMLTAQSFEALRTQGTTLLDDKVRELDGELVKSNPASVWMHTCLDAVGNATRTVVWSSTPRTSQVFMRATSDWQFKPYRLREVATEVCSMSLLTYPASKAPSIETLPKGATPYTRTTYSFEDDLDFVGPTIKTLPSIATLQSMELAVLARSPLDPKPATASQLAHAAPDRISRINVCIDIKGDVKNVVTLDQQPGDRQRAAKLWRWKFRPYTRNGSATEACAEMPFIVLP